MQTTISPTLVSRVCGLPATAVDDLRAPEASSAIRMALDAEACANHVARALSEDLFALVPTLDDAPSARRAALRLRRDVHNARRTEATRAAEQAVGPLLDQAAAERLIAWAHAIGERDDQVRKATEVIAGELAAANDRAHARLLTPSVHRGLAFASPAYARELGKKGTRAGSLGSRDSRSAVAYLARTALKPSPFATLATIGLTGFSECGANAVQQHGGGRVLTASRTAALALWRAWAQTDSGARTAPLVLNPSLRQAAADGTPTVRGALPLYVQAHTVLFRQDELTDCETSRWAIDGLRQTDGDHGDDGRASDDLAIPPATASSIATRLGVPLDTVLRLVETGVLVPVTPWTLDATDEFASAARWLGGDGGTIEAVPAAIRTIADITTDIAHTATAAAITRATDRARSAVADAFRVSGTPVPHWLPGLPVLHETVAHDGAASPSLPPSIADDLRQLGNLLRPHVRLNAGYRRLVDAFVARHGAGARAGDLLAFLYDVMAGVDAWVLDACLGDVDPAAPDPALLAGVGTLGPPCHTAFFQVAAADEAAVRAGDYRVVLNNVQPGFPGLTSRWAIVPELRAALGEELARWAAVQHPDCVTYGFSAHADWVDFQRPTIDTLPRVTWAADGAARPPGAVDLAGFTLEHDRATNTLQVRDRDGERASFAYLGAIPPRILRGVDRLLGLLTDPWVTPDLRGRALGAAVPGGEPSPGRDAARAAAIESDHERGLEAGPAARRLPRLRAGNLILRRATWLLPAAHLPRLGGDPIRFLTDVERWRKDHGLPDEVFVRRLPMTWSGRPEKPQWVGFDCPHTVAAGLHGVAGDDGVVEITEALPARTEHWARNEAGEPVAVEFSAVIHDA